MRQRLYNPAQLSSNELKASFIARQETLEELHRIIREEKPDRPCQHLLLIGPRGMGKTTLGLRFLLSIEEVSEFAASWQPVAFDEESYGIGDLADFWLTALDHLSRATDEPRWAKRADAIREDEYDPERQAVYARAALRDFYQESGKRLILFVENLDVIFGQLGDEREIHTLRASLIERSDILLVGSANTVFDAIRGHGQPFYEFFQLFILEGLGPEDTHRMLESYADGNGTSDLPETLRRERGRLETVRRLTGGNPRLLVLACRMLIESPLGAPLEDLERLIDEQTPYFKARIEELPVQGRRVFHCLAAGWRPMLAKEVAVASKLSSSHASAQLRQLVDKGYARESRLPREKRVRYEVSDRFYNIYYLLRFSRTGRQRLERLVHFLRDLFGPTGMRAMYPAALDSLREHGLPTGESSDLLGILAGYVARDEDYGDREDWRRNAISLINDMLGTNAPVIGETEQAFADQLTGISRRVLDVLDRGTKLIEAKRYADAEVVYRELLDDETYRSAALVYIGYLSSCQKRFDDALAAFDTILESASVDGTIELRRAAFAALIGKSMVFSEQEHEDLAATAVERSWAYIRPDDPPSLRALGARSLERRGQNFASGGQKEAAIAVWGQAAEYAHPLDSEELRLSAAEALESRGHILEDLGRQEEAHADWARVSDYVDPGDSENLRRTAFFALCFLAKAHFTAKRFEDSSVAWRRAAEFLRSDDHIELRQPIAKLLVASERLLNRAETHRESVAVYRRATDLDPAYDEAWISLAEMILEHGDDTEVAEAEGAARRAVDLAPDNSAALRVLSNILVRRGNWVESVSLIERALEIGGEELQTRIWPGLTESLIRVVAAGHGRRVRQLMENSGLGESMEPLWHAVQAELGEDLEPLPVEVMDAVTDIRNRIATRR